VKLDFQRSLSVDIIYEPYNFELTASAYSFSWQFDGKVLKIPLRLSDDFVIVKVRKVSERSLNLDIWSSTGSVRNDEVVEKICRILNLDEDLKEFYNICKSDVLLRKVPEGLRMRSCDSWYAFLIAISQQNTSFKMGWSMLYRLHKYLGKKVLTGNEIFILPPNPEEIIKFDEKSLRDVGYGYRSSIIVEVARKFVSVGDDLRKVLVNIKGVGPYTRNLALLLAYRDYNNVIIDRWVKGLYETILNVKDVENYLRRKWHRYVGLVTWYLTIVLDAEPLSKAIERARKGMLEPTFTGLTPLTLWKYM